MSENNFCEHYDESVEIDLIDLMFYLLQQWKMLIVAIVIGIFIGGGIYILKKSDPIPESSIVEENLISAEERYEISPDETANMELAYQYRQLYRKQLEYNQKSIIMQLDPNAVYTGELKYYISAGYDTGLISILYQNILSDKNLLEELKEVSQLDCDEPYMKELINCSINQDGESTININNMLDALIDSSNNVNRSSVITYTVISTSEESCDQMLQVIRERVSALNQECVETYEQFSSQEVNDAVRLVTNNDYLNKQKANIDQLNTYLSNVQRLENAFGEDALAYYNEVYLAREYEADTEELPVLDTNIEQGAENPVKWFAVGMFLMVVCWAAFYSLKYLLDKHVKTVEELVKVYNLPLLGHVEMRDHPQKGINEWLYLQRRNRRGAIDTISYVSTIINSLNENRLFLCINPECDKELQFSSQVQKSCGKLQVGSMIHQDGEALGTAKCAEGIIMTVVIGYTDQREIRRALEVCRIQNFRVLGVIALEV